MAGEQSRARAWGRGRVPIQISALALLVVVAAILAQAVAARNSPIPVDVTDQRPFVSLGGDSNETTDPSDVTGTDLASQIQVALDAEQWPDFAVPLDALSEARAPEWIEDGCIDIAPSDVPRCTYDGPAQRTAVILGDSVAVSWAPGVRAVLADEGYQTTLLTMDQCPAARAAMTDRDGEDGFEQRCRDFRTWSMQTIGELAPDLVIFSSAEDSLERLASGATGEEAQQEWQQSLEGTLLALAQPDRSLVVLAPPPAGADLQDCFGPANDPSSCESTISDRWVMQAQAEQAAVSDVEGTFYINSEAWFCNQDAACPAFVGDVPVRADTAHLTALYAQRLAPQLSEALQEVT